MTDFKYITFKFFFFFFYHEENWSTSGRVEWAEVRVGSDVRQRDSSSVSEKTALPDGSERRHEMRFGGSDCLKDGR